MKRLSFILSLLFLLGLTACGTIIRLEGIEIEFPERQTTPTQEVLTLTPSPSPSATARPTNTPSPTMTPTQAGATATALVNVNVRSGAGISFSIIGLLQAGQSVAITGKNAAGDWYQIRFGTVLGWVSANPSLISASGNLQSIPIVSAPIPATTTPTRVAMSRIGYNINGEAVPNMDTLLGELVSPCKSLNLVMNNLSLAVQIKERCPDSYVVSRSYSRLEGDEWVYRTPQQFVEQCNREGNKQIIRHSTNEPSFGSGQRLIEFVNKEIELMRLARAAGCTFAMGNFSVGIFEPEDINAGYFDNYIRAFHQYGHYLALHEYSVAVLPFGVGRWTTGYLLDRIFVQPANWPRASDLPTCPNGEFGSYWYLMRGTWFLCRADTIGVPRPPILVTEFGWDNLPNIKPQIEPLRQQFGLPQYFFDMRGVNTYPRLWAYYYPQWSFAEAVCHQLAWAESIYPPDYLGFALFTWGWYPDSPWRQTDFSGRENPAMFEAHKCS